MLPERIRGYHNFEAAQAQEGAARCRARDARKSTARRHTRTRGAKLCRCQLRRRCFTVRARVRACFATRHQRVGVC